VKTGVFTLFVVKRVYNWYANYVYQAEIENTLIQLIHILTFKPQHSCFSL